jgi:hypothetical protein
MNLLEMKFSEGTVRYTDKFQIVLEGSLYPRQLQAANQIIQIYKEVTKQDKGTSHEPTQQGRTRKAVQRPAQND